jgi:hypothetical protein
MAHPEHVRPENPKPRSFFRIGKSTQITNTPDLALFAAELLNGSLKRQTGLTRIAVLRHSRIFPHAESEQRKHDGRPLTK